MAEKLGDIEEVSVSRYRKRMVGLFDRLERDGDFKVFLPKQIADIPACETFVWNNALVTNDEPSFKYEFPDASLTRLSNSTVSRTGAVLKDGYAINETLEGSIAENFNPSNLENAISLPEVVAASRYGNFNHAIFLCETSPLLYLSGVDEQTQGMPKVLYFDRTYCSESFEKEHVNLVDRLWSGTDTKWIAQPVSAESVFIPSVSRRVGAFRASLMTRFLTERIVSYPADASKVGRKSATNIYISRRYANSRVPVNIDELENIAKLAGFIPVHLELMTFSEQIELMQSVQCVLSEHGAGLINLMFCKGGTKILELFPSAMYAKWTFRLIAYSAGLNYSCGSFKVADGWIYNRDPVAISPEFFSHCLKVLAPL